MAGKSAPDWRAVARYGLLGGVIAVYVSVIGMVEAFSTRNILGTFLNLGNLILFVGPLVAAYFATRRLDHDNPIQALLSGAVAGFVAGLPVVALIALASAIDLRGVFINISPNLISILTLEQSLVVGSVLGVLSSAALGTFVALVFILPAQVRGAVLTALLVTVVIFGVFSENVRQILEQNFGRNLARLFYRNQSLVPTTALVVFVLTAGLVLLKNRFWPQVETRYAAAAPPRQRLMRQVFMVLGLALLFVLPWVAGTFLSQVLFIVLMYVVMALGLNIVVGFAGLLDLGYVAFFAFGAYTMGVLTTTGPLNMGGLNFWMALPIAILVAVFFGLLLGFPVLRMRGDYLAITTLGFGEIIRLLALSNWLAPLTGGAQGVLFIPSPTLGPLEFDRPEMMYYLVLVGSIVGIFIARRLRDGRLGRQWVAMREDEDVAEAMGINLVRTKLLAFAIGAGFSGLSGAIFAARLGNIFPHSFNLLISINVLAIIIVGGLGSIPGVFVGALVLVGMPELLREFAEYRLLLYGILLIVMMLNKPEGFLPTEIAKRELRGEDELEAPDDDGTAGMAPAVTPGPSAA